MARKNTRAVGSRARLSQSYTKLVLVSRKPLLFLANLTNPINKTFMRLIHLIDSTFLSLKIIVDTDRCRDLRNIKHQNKHITLFSDANVPVRFRAQQRAKYSSLQLTANYIAAKRCLPHYFKLI